MPFKSEKQRRFLHAKHPEVAAKFEKEEKMTIKGPKGRFVPSKRTGKHAMGDVQCTARNKAGKRCTKTLGHSFGHGFPRKK